MNETFICRYCQGEMVCSARSYEENPFCQGCLHERMERAAAERGPFKWVQDGDYVRAVPVEDPSGVEPVMGTPSTDDLRRMDWEHTLPARVDQLWAEESRWTIVVDRASRLTKYVTKADKHCFPSGREHALEIVLELLDGFQIARLVMSVRGARTVEIEEDLFRRLVEQLLTLEGVYGLADG